MRADPPAASRSENEAALRHLRDSGVITAAEYDDLTRGGHSVTGPIQVLVVGFDRLAFLR